MDNFPYQPPGKGPSPSGFSKYFITKYSSKCALLRQVNCRSYYSHAGHIQLVVVDFFETREKEEHSEYNLSGGEHDRQATEHLFQLQKRVLEPKCVHHGGYGQKRHQEHKDGDQL